jgi:hypothetical protein
MRFRTKKLFGGMCLVGNSAEHRAVFAPPPGGALPLIVLRMEAAGRGTDRLKERSGFLAEVGAEAI